MIYSSYMYMAYTYTQAFNYSDIGLAIETKATVDKT